MNWNFKRNFKLRGVQILALGFLLLILVALCIIILKIDLAECVKYLSVNPTTLEL